VDRSAQVAGSGSSNNPHGLLLDSSITILQDLANQLTEYLYSSTILIFQIMPLRLRMLIDHSEAAKKLLRLIDRLEVPHLLLP